jgi:hypothetical protein
VTARYGSSNPKIMSPQKRGGSIDEISFRNFIYPPKSFFTSYYLAGP